MPGLSDVRRGPSFHGFLAERHLATLTLVRRDGRPHVTPVGFTWSDEEECARVITWSGSVKARVLAAGPLEAAICQVDGGRWLTIEGTAEVSDDPEVCRSAVEAYAARYRPPKDRGAERRVITVATTMILGSTGLLDGS
ncbi:MAG: acyltransferase [Acidimicrobiaceae bacterium]|nr:acyltransferase [Acidimicrobiaceae bacterium]|tara:strand:- start:1402 stop:1818 length:417 start_codon:yes stop_codon:yes gene_type:complete